MSKPQKKGKGPRRSQDGRGFNESTLDQLTSKLDKSLNTKDNNKRKNPPTASSDHQNQKRLRNSEGGLPNKKESKSNGKIGRNQLLGEIKALGGDEKDLELIGDIDSEDEEYVKDAKQTVDKGLKDEIAAFSKQLGLADVAPSEASDEEEEEEEEEEEGDADSDKEMDNGQEEAEEDADDDDEPEMPAPKKPGDIIFEPRADWHAAKLPKLPTPSSDEINSFIGAITPIKEYARSLLDQDAEKYRSSVFAQSSHKFLTTIMSSGTLTDKVSALTLAVQESPVHNIRAFDALMGLASKKSRAQAIGAIGALVDLLGPGTLLPANRRLRTFQTQPGLLGTLQENGIKTWSEKIVLPGKITQGHLVSWAYEDWLKESYFKIIQLLEVWCSDEIEYSRTRALDFVYGLLKEKPEQEANLLRLLVNKLGDRDRKISSRASYLLLQLQNSHPGMKPIIVRTIEQEILLHPSQDHRSKYYAINTLNQTILSNKEPGIAEALMRVYFDLFVVLLKAGSLGIAAPSEATNEPTAKKGGKYRGRPGPRPGPRPVMEQETETADKLVSAVLTGVNRAAPFMAADDTIMESHLDTLFKIAHSANFNTSIQALLLIQHLSTSRNLASDRFYRVLYESLLDPRLVTSSKQALYLNLLLRSLKNDLDVRRVKAFAKRMLQISGLHQPAFTCGLLYVITSLQENFPDLATLINEPEESIFDDEDSERPMYDGRKRNPEHSNAGRSCLWEVIPLQGHYHPTVTVFASSLGTKDEKVQKPDLDSHSLIRFLDKFVYRNAKVTDSTKGVSIMQPLRASKDIGDMWLGSRSTGAATTQSVNSSAFRNKKVENVAVEDVFFHQYFQQVAKEGKDGKDKKKKDAGEDDEDGQEDEIWKALVDSRPEVDEDGSDLGFDDLNEDEMASDGDSEPALDLDDEDFDDDDLDDDDMSVDIEGSDEEGEEGGALLAAAEEDFEVKDAVEEKRKKNKERRKQLKELPMFASVDDYAELLAGEEDM